jgi:hypothetical protein
MESHQNRTKYLGDTQLQMISKFDDAFSHFREKTKAKTQEGANSAAKLFTKSAVSNGLRDVM